MNPQRKGWRSFYNSVIDMLIASSNVEKIDVKPTAWDEYRDFQSSWQSEIRIGEGHFFD